MYNINYLDSTTHFEATMLIKRYVKHYELGGYKYRYQQTTDINIDERFGMSFHL